SAALDGALSTKRVADSDGANTVTPLIVSPLNAANAPVSFGNVITSYESPADGPKPFTRTASNVPSRTAVDLLVSRPTPPPADRPRRGAAADAAGERAGRELRVRPGYGDDAGRASRRAATVGERCHGGERASAPDVDRPRVAGNRINCGKRRTDTVQRDAAAV